MFYKLYGNDSMQLYVCICMKNVSNKSTNIIASYVRTSTLLYTLKKCRPAK